MIDKIEGVYFIKDDKQQVIGFIFRDPVTGHKLVHSSQEVDLEQLAEMIIGKPKNSESK